MSYADVPGVVVSLFPVFRCDVRPTSMFIDVEVDEHTTRRGDITRGAREYFVQ